MNITVLYGGPSAEREVSLVSGKAVIDGLRQMGHEVFGSDISPTDLSGLDRPHDVIFPVLHGEFGESGELQEILEKRHLKFVGSGSRASRLGMNKVAAKQVWDTAGLPTAPYVVLKRGDALRWNAVGVPCVLKPVSSGSSIDVLICTTEREASEACTRLLAKYDEVLVEKFIRGPELTIGILEERALHPIRIVTPNHQFYTYEAKYQGGTEYHFDLNLPPDVVKRVQDIALKAHQALGCRDLSRVDIMLDEANRPYILEINTLPGFTSKSLLPKAAGHEGIDFPKLVHLLARRAANR